MMTPTPQAGIFAYGTSSDTYLELDFISTEPEILPQVITLIREALTPTSGCNLVLGFSPSWWKAQRPEDCPEHLAPFTEPVVGDDGFTMPATQHDLFLWISGAQYDAIFDLSSRILTTLAPFTRQVTETRGWVYREGRDLTGFIDGTENPVDLDAHAAALVPSGPGAGGSVLLLQHWLHNQSSWESLSVADQENIMGRSKADSVEFDPKAETSHVERTDQGVFGHILRRNIPYGTSSRHGTLFVGFSATQEVLAQMLRSMAGIDTPRDALTRYTEPTSGAYYFIPSLESLDGIVGPSND